MSALSPKFWNKVEMPANGAACWQWTGVTNPDGYGRFYASRRTTMAHRYAYERLRGPIPEGLFSDHLCRNRGCVNPWHIEITTMRENVMRSDGLTAVNARRTHCHRGHPLKGDNLRIENIGRTGNERGVRVCRTCRRLRQNQARKLAAKKPL